MKIAISLTKMSLGGGTKSTLILGTYLASQGHDVTIVTERKGEWWSELSSYGLQGCCIPYPRWSSRVRRAELLAQYWNTQGFDQVIINVPLHKPSVYACHMLEDRVGVLFILRSDWRPWYELAHRDQAYWNCAVGVSPKVEKGLAAHCPGKPVFYIPNGVASPSDQELESRLGWEQPLRLIWVGRLVDNQKGIFRLPLILSRCQQKQIPVTLTIVGDGPDRAPLVRLFKKYGVYDQVTLVGPQGLSQIPALMRQHHILLFPSNIEGVPNVVLEAMANGCVPIASFLLDITTAAIEHDRTGILLEPTNISGFVDGIQFMRDPKAWRRMSAAGAEQMRLQFPLKKTGEQYETLLVQMQNGAYPVQRPYNQQPSRRAIPFHWSDHLPTLPEFAKNQARHLRHRMGHLMK